MKQVTLYQSVVIISSLAALTGCAHVSVRNAVPENLVGKATVAGMPDLRFYTGKPAPAFMLQSLADSFKQEDPSAYRVDGVKTYPVLVIGGGVSNSAYGIGLLNGWSGSGSRPVFKIVTGYSSGSLLATAAFAGKEYEERLADLFTSISTKDVMKEKNIFEVLSGNSINSSVLFAKKIDDLMDKGLMDRIALEYQKGRRLYVATSDLDAQELVLWDMGALAARGDSDSLRMFRKIILASCSYPPMVPPVFFQVEAGGRHYDEMHADGGVVGGLFHVYQLMEGGRPATENFKTRLFILNCCYMSPHSKQVEDNLTAITSRMIETNGSSKMSGDTYRIYAFARERGWDYNLAYIPEDFKPEQKEMFDKLEMQRLFKRGRDDAAKGYAWHKAPPGLVDVTRSVNEP